MLAVWGETRKLAHGRKVGIPDKWRGERQGRHLYEMLYSSQAVLLSLLLSLVHFQP